MSLPVAKIIFFAHLCAVFLGGLQAAKDLCVWMGNAQILRLAEDDNRILCCELVGLDSSEWKALPGVVATAWPVR